MEKDFLAVTQNLQKMKKIDKFDKKISIWDDKKVLEVDSGMIAKPMWMYLTPLNYTLKNG